MDDTLAANQFATFEEWDQAVTEHDRAAASIANQFVGALRGQDADGGASEQHKARMWDLYAEKIREWDANRPEWVR